MEARTLSKLTACYLFDSIFADQIHPTRCLTESDRSITPAAPLAFVPPAHVPSFSSLPALRLLTPPSEPLTLSSHLQTLPVVPPGLSFLAHVIAVRRYGSTTRPDTAFLYTGVQLPFPEQINVKQQRVAAYSQTSVPK